jgi:hypothetical protein
MRPTIANRNSAVPRQLKACYFFADNQPMNQQPKPPLPRQQQPMAGHTDKMKPKPDHGEESYRGSGKLTGKKAVITGADSGIGRAVAIAYAREGADVLISYLNEHEDAEETRRLVEEAGRKAILMAGDIGSPVHWCAIVEKAVSELGGIDILINNAAHQATFKSIEDISDEEWELTFGGQHPRDVLPDEGRGAENERRRRDHQHGIDQRGQAQPDIARVCDHQRCDPELHGGPRAAACREGHSR